MSILNIIEDIKILRETHFLSKNLTDYLISMLNIENSPIPFDYNKAINLRHRLKKKFVAARLFLKICQEVNLFDELNKIISFRFKGDYWNFFDIMDSLNAFKRVKLKDINHDEKLIKFRIIPIDFECSFYHDKNYYTILFSTTKDYYEVDKILFVLGFEYTIEDLIKDLEQNNYDPRQLKILIIPPFYREMDMIKIIQAYNLTSLHVNVKNITESDVLRIIKKLI